MEVLKLFAVMMAALTLGKWFQSELTKNRRAGRPWHAVYASPPGLLILMIVLLLPVSVWLVGKAGG
ncbi:MAG: hypothetical protein CSB33_00725 [Desulfobacterales bacterium]|nr:MAG: hypothetical protein CSB33_00725 [Desulfobacterales bacterium]